MMSAAKEREKLIKTLERTVVWLENYMLWKRLKEQKDARMDRTHKRS